MLKNQIIKNYADFSLLSENDESDFQLNVQLIKLKLMFIKLILT